MAQHDAEGRGAHQPHGRNIVGMAHGQRFGPRDAGIGRPGGDGDGENGILDAGAHGGDEGERQDELGKGEEDIGDAHQHRIHPSARIAGDSTDEQADRCCDDCHEDDDEQRQPRAVDEARENVAALVVGAEQKAGGARRQQPRGGEIAGNRRMRRQKIGKERDEDQQHEDGEAENGQRIGGKPPPAHIGAAEPGLQS